VEHRVEGGLKWVRANEETVPDTSYTVKGLKEGLEYEFRVSAENKAGVGPASDPTDSIKIQEQLSMS
jgi:titin